MQRIENMDSNVTDEVLQKLKIQIGLDQQNVSEVENQNSEFSSIIESINMDLKVKIIEFFEFYTRHLPKYCTENLSIIATALILDMLCNSSPYLCVHPVNIVILGE